MKTKTNRGIPLYYLFLPILLCFLPEKELLAQGCEVTYSANDLPYSTESNNAPQASIQHLDQWLEVDLKNLGNPFFKDKEAVYRDRCDYLKRLVEDDYFLFIDSLQAMVDGLGKRLLTANTIANADRLQFLISRTGIPNASCRGEGTIIINLGLLTRLQNTDQLAFILAHELGHHHLDHVNKNIQERIDFLNSKSTTKKIEASRSGKEMANTELRDWLKENALDDSRHSRTDELLTDSLGMVFYLNAGFPPPSALSALQSLAHIDDAPGPLPELKTYFEFSDYPWREEWMISHLSGLSLVKISDEEKLLLRTHPDLEKRVEQAQKILPEVEAKPKEDLCAWKGRLELEILERSYEVRDLFSTLLQALRITGTAKENSYANSMIAHCLLDLHKARKQHNFGKFIPSPNSRMREDYLQVATFLDNLSTSNLKNISQRWTQQNCSTVSDEESAAALKIKAQRMENENFNEATAIAAFQQKWPNSIYF